jgi:hypothetical protein
VQELSIGGLTLKNLPSVAFEGMPFPKSDESPRGVIGPYSLKGLLVTLDYPREMIIFRRGELGPPDEQEIFGWKGNTPLPETPVSVAGKTILVHLDSGSSGALSVPVDLVDELPLAGPLVDKGYAKTVDQVEPVRGATLAGDLRIGRYRLENPTVHFVDIAKKTGNVGAGILSQFAMTYDPANRRLRLDGPEDGRLAPVEDKKPRYGLQLTALESEPLEVNVVDAGSVAEKAGLKAGDRIMSMNGRPIGELAVDDRLVALKGSPLQVTVRRGDGTLDVSMTLEP